MSEGNENQKPVTNAYRDAWDRIFKEKDGSLTLTVGENDGLCEIRIEKLPTNLEKPF